MKKFILILLLFGCVMQCFAQSNNDKAKAYYFNAEEQYQNKNYDKAIEYCEAVPATKNTTTCNTNTPNCTHKNKPKRITTNAR